MMVFIESSVCLADIARATKTTVTKVEADCRELSLYVGHDWPGQPSLSTVDAHAYVSGDARRDRDHVAAQRAHTTATDAWADQREACRRAAYGDTFDTARRRGVGDPQAASEAARAASAALVNYEKSTPQPTFGDGAPSRLSMRSRARKVVLR